MALGSQTKPIGSDTGGVYDVTESGVHFRHMPPLPTPKDGQEFLERFRYVPKYITHETV